MLQPVVRLCQHAYRGLSPSVWLLAGVRFGFYYVQLVSLLFGGVFLLGLQFVTGFYTLCGSVFLFKKIRSEFADPRLIFFPTFTKIQRAELAHSLIHSFAH